MTYTLDDQRQEFKERRFVAMPIAGMIMWALLIVTGSVLNEQAASLAIFIGTGCIVYLGLFVSRFTGENLMKKGRRKNAFDMMFMAAVVQALLVFSIAIPFFLIEPSSLPLSVGILTGLMWVPLSWAIEHWVGLFHTLVRTVSIVLLWYLFPELRFVLIPIAIVVVYGVTIAILEVRWRSLNGSTQGRTEQSDGKDECTG